ncbi:MAG TPA: flagellar export chaperone FlgN [Candidatus Bathyarchaeia archaeon]|nr:flagellar export chaperone FlgN [Candidatus Bathyarchaeia archaeon]
MSGLFERLCEMLEDEVERQENVLAVCQAQSEAMKSNDIEYLEAKTAALVVLIQEAAQAARERSAVLEAIVAEHSMNREGLVFSDVVAAAPEPLRGRLTESHRRLRAVLKATRPVVLSNTSSLRHAVRAVRASLAAVRPEAPSGSAYDATGMHQPAKPGLVNTMDQRG